MTQPTRIGLEPLQTVGNDTPRIDAVERVTGAAQYTGDVKLPGMVYARVLRSPHPHARIVAIDVSAALALPGVLDVITGETSPIVWGAGSISGGRQYNDPIKEATLHRRYIFNNPVRCVGDSVAAVAATDRNIAEQALDLIEVEYEELPFVLEPEAALADDAPSIWPEGNMCPDTRNNFEPMTSRIGAVEAGFAEADLDRAPFEDGKSYGRAEAVDVELDRDYGQAAFYGDQARAVHERLDGSADGQLPLRVDQH